MSTFHVFVGLAAVAGFGCASRYAFRRVRFRETKRQLIQYKIRKIQTLRGENDRVISTVNKPAIRLKM